ncbi:hypothetical protein DER45DRAFT_556999 [Fusarium avenaceum]|nr:hypothetical protein DER45DRAFT_556999 [Fusarium avenaceum]
MAKKKCLSKTKPKAKAGTDATVILADIKESKPTLSGTSSIIDQPSIGKLIRRWITDKEASDILLQFHKACIPNQQVLWSGMLRATAQQWADAHGFQTLTTSMGPLLRTDDPDCCYFQKTKNDRINYIHGASIVFAWHISQGDLVTVLSQPPPQRFHPTGRTFYQLYEEPIIKGMLGNRPVTRIVVAHPTIQSALDFTYEMWPHDEFSLWTENFGIQDIVIYWRKVKTGKNTAELSATAPVLTPSASTIKTDVVENCGSSATSDSDSLKSPESLMISETENMKQLWMSPSTDQKVTERNDQNDTLIEPNQGAKELIRETTSTSLQLFAAAGFDRIVVEASGKRKKPKKDKKLKNKSLSTRKTWNDLQEITIEKLVRDDSSMSLQLLIDAAYGRIVIEVGETMKEKKARKKAEKMDRNMAKMMKKEARRKDSSRGHKFDGERKITIETLVKDESSESLQLLIDAAYGIIQIEVGESKEERRERKKRERVDMKIGWAMQNATKKKQSEEMSGKNNETKQATAKVSDKDGPEQNNRSKIRAKRQLRKLERKRAKEAESGIKKIEKVKRFLGKKL